MFGIYRLLLAIVVVIAHIAEPGDGWSSMAGHAVFAFFVLSGYLMTKVTNRKYGFDATGMGRFLLNRILRIYPLYWVVLFSTLAIIATARDASAYHPLMLIPRSFSEWFANATMFTLAKGGFAPLAEVIVVPPSWALEIELFFYVAIGLGLGQRRLWLLWLCGTIAIFSIIKLLQAMGIVTRGFSYGSIPYGSIAFLTGAAVYHYGEWVARVSQRISSSRIVSLCVPSVLAFWVASPFAVSIPAGIRLGLTAILHGLIVLHLSRWMVLRDSRIAQLDRWLGGCSYPLYLIHYPVGLFLWAVFDVPARGFNAFAVVLPVALLMSLFLYWLVEKRIESVRDTVRGGTAANDGCENAISLGSSVSFKSLH